MDEEIKKAIELLNKNEYVVIPVSKGQMCLCDGCREDESRCRYNAIGYACSNLLCINSFVKEQLNYKEIISQIE